MVKKEDMEDYETECELNQNYEDSKNIRPYWWESDEEDSKNIRPYWWESDERELLKAT